MKKAMIIIAAILLVALTGGLAAVIAAIILGTSKKHAAIAGAIFAGTFGAAEFGIRTAAARRGSRKAAEPQYIPPDK